MLTTTDLRAVAAARLQDAQTLLAAGRYDWAVYTSGYAVECALKARIAITLNWSGFPNTPQGVRAAQEASAHVPFLFAIARKMDHEGTKGGHEGREEKQSSL